MRIRSRIETIIIASLLLMGLFALAVTVKVTVTMLEKKDQITDGTLKNSSTAKNIVRTVYPTKLNQMDLYFNGKKYDGLYAYRSEKNTIFIPADRIAEILGGKLSFYSPDDIAQTTLGGVSMCFKLGSDAYKAGRADVGLPAAPVAAKGHILVPIEALAPVKGFSLDKSKDDRTIFLNYYSSYDNKEYTALRVLRQISNNFNVTDLLGMANYWEAPGVTPENESYMKSENGFTWIVNIGDKPYLVKYGKTVTPKLLDAPSSAGLTRDGKYLYWLDEAQNNFYVMDIANKTKTILNDYFWYVYSDIYNGQKASELKLRGYSVSSSFTRLVFTGSGLTSDYTLILRHGKVVAEGYASYSFDYSKLLFNRPGKGYYCANQDGTRIIRLRGAVSAKWLTNRYIMLAMEDGSYIYNVKTKTKSKVSEKLNQIGKTPRGEILYVKGNTLFCDNGSNDIKLMDLPWETAQVFAASSKGPFIFWEKMNDRLFYRGKEGLSYIGDGKLLPKNGKGIAISPGGKTIAVIHGGDYMSVLLLNSDGSQAEVCLEMPSETDTGFVWPQPLWVSDSSLVLFTGGKGWLIKTGKKAMVYSWSEIEGTVINDIAR